MRLNTTDVFLLKWERQEREAREHQRWCHAYALRDEEARADHDWDSCPECDRIGFDRRFVDLPKLSPNMQHKRELKLQRRERRAVTRRAKRRELRSRAA